MTRVKIEVIIYMRKSEGPVITMIDEKSFLSELTRVFKENGMSSMLNIEKSKKLFALTVRMLEENEKYNLTAITDVDKIILNHYADCAALAQVLPRGVSIADIGCGAGFPTLPVAILREDVKITAIDSTAKRVAYVERSAELLGLTNVKCVTMRAEDGGASPEFREKYDIATARAVAELRVLAELALPYVKVGGKLMAMKGKNAELEVKGAKRAVAILGGGDAECREIKLTNGRGEELSHPLVIVAKKQKTPSAYPRPYAKISKNPL